MNNDLISRSYIVEVYNRVKVVCKNCDNYNGVRCRACDIGDELLDLQDIIDNAPTVDSSDAKYLEERDADAYESGYLQGHIEGYQKAEKDCARPIGEWILEPTRFEGVVTYICNECKALNDLPTHFCPNCGAKMKGGKE